MNSAISVGFDSHSSYLTFIYNICPLQALARRPKRAFYPVFLLAMKIMSDLSYAAEEYSQMPSIQLKLKQKKI